MQNEEGCKVSAELIWIFIQSVKQIIIAAISRCGTRSSKVESAQEYFYGHNSRIERFELSPLNDLSLSLSLPLHFKTNLRRSFLLFIRPRNAESIILPWFHLLNWLSKIKRIDSIDPLKKTFEHFKNYTSFNFLLHNSLFLINFLIYFWYVDIILNKNYMYRYTRKLELNSHDKEICIRKLLIYDSKNL